MAYKGFLLTTAGLAIAILSFSMTQARELTLEQRVLAQEAIEEVYWLHRIWPDENPTPKPPLSEVMTDEEIRGKVEDYLKKSNALETWWQRPITAEQLQAELDRIARGTRDAEMLRELFAALDNDAFLIAETLARPTLVERLIRNWYAFDKRFHEAVKSDAERALAGTRSVTEMTVLGGEYGERTFVRRGVDEEVPGKTPEDGIVELDAEEWTEWVEDLARQFGTTPEAVPVQQVSALQEDSDWFFVTGVLSLEADRAVVATVVWRKRTFDSWWVEERVGTSAEVVAEVGDYTIAAPMSSGCVDDTWESRFYVPAGRYGPTAMWTGAEMIVWGGSNGSYLNTGGRYNPSTDSWTTTSTATNVPVGRTSHTAVWTGTEMIVWGGSNGSYLNTGGRYNPSMDSWTTTSTGANVPSARISHAAVWTGTEMIIWGGVDGSSSNTGGPYNPSTDSWTATSTGANVPSARYLHTAVWTGAEMIVWGGYDGSYLNTGGRYNPSTDSWTATSTGANVPSARSGHTAVWTGAEMIVWGGYDGSSSNTGGRYNPSTDSWTATSTGANVPLARGHTAVWTGTEMIVWGGSGGSTSVNTGGRYNPSTDSWTATSTGANAPLARSAHAAVWTGTEMIIWGGLGGFGDFMFPLNAGGRYHPSTDSWTATSTGTNVPSGRGAHTAVWTGTEMIVWGGQAHHAYVFLNTGGRYIPSTDSWIATSMGANVPSVRPRHTAVWTGTEMIVWGGGSYLNTGGRYNPSADSWTATSTGTNVPSGRYEHTAVWTGTEMIVWGGDEVSTGGRYNPSTDSWTATSIGANVPSSRSRHTAVWMGTEMIVWGGYDGGPSLNTGGRYNPSTDSWTATSTGANVPSARTLHTAVWTGAEMIVWGGYNGPYLNTGGRYHPSTDSWIATSTGPNVPSGRSSHTAVWTGAEMIVWGGWDASFLSLNTGGRYNPSTDNWTATSAGADVPSARYSYTAVWTAPEMIVWGGFPLDSNIGLYCACSSTPDSDGDGVGDVCDSAPLDPLLCRDFDADACDDCSSGTFNPANDGVDTDGDGACDTGDADGVADGQDSAPLDPFICRDFDADACDDCLSGTFNPANDGGDTDGDGACDTGDSDDDADGVADGQDAAPLDPFLCQDLDADGCDDCSSGTFNPANDGVDTDGDGACNTGDPDDDSDSVADGQDTAPLDPFLCQDLDADGCDDCSSGTSNPANDGPDPDADGLCNTGDSDDDGDGVADGEDSASLDPNACRDIDADGCDDCSSGIVDPANDGPDPDADGLCDLGDNCREAFNPGQADLDHDEYGDACDNCMLAPNDQADLDSDDRGDVCDNCAAEFNPVQEDFDDDQVGDACDNCHSVNNASQSDLDEDLEGDPCDLDDSVIYLSFKIKNRLLWQNEAGYDRWNAYRGDLSVLLNDGTYTQEPGSNPLAAHQCGMMVTAWGWVGAPDPGQTAFFLVTGVALGVEGDLGVDSSGIPRPNDHPCP